MSLKVLSDPESEQRSLMSQRVPCCNGHKTGYQCRHYWYVQCNIQPLQDADFYKEGEKLRRCMLVVPSQNLDYKDLATTCSLYEPSTRTYDAKQEEYNPLTPEEVAALRCMHKRHKSTQPFIAELALAEYKRVAEVDPGDPFVVEVRRVAREELDDYEQRKREGEEARRRNLAEMEQRQRDADDAKRKVEQDRADEEARVAKLQAEAAEESK